MQEMKRFLVIFQDLLLYPEKQELIKKINPFGSEIGLFLDGIFKQGKEIILILEPDLTADVSRIEEVSAYTEIEISEIVGRIFPDKNFLIQLLIE